jgi:glycerol-3-phosphate O-acyltransferase
LPANLQTDDIRQAVEVLQIMNQNDRERMLDEARQKAWRDASIRAIRSLDELIRKTESFEDVRSQVPAN